MAKDIKISLYPVNGGPVPGADRIGDRCVFTSINQECAR
jgi:hypothetical protein